MSLAGRVVVIAGATGGLGRVVAAICAAQGANLALLSTNDENLQNLARELQLPAERYLTHAAQIADANATRQAADAVIARFARADVLLNLVGGWVGGKAVPEVEAEQVAQMLEQHLWTTFHLAQAFVPHLVANQWGRIIAVSSPAASNPVAKRAPYAIGKAAQEALCLTLAREVQGTGVTVNLLLADTIDVKHERDNAPNPKNAKWTTPEEIAAAILYLCSDEAHTVNGARIPMYGG